MTDVSVSGADFKAVALAQAEQIVNLQVMVQAVLRQMAALEAEHAKCPKKTKAEPPQGEEKK